MSLRLEQLKQKLEENPAAKGFYAATLGSRVVDGQVHAIAYCTVGKPEQKPVARTLEEILELDHSHECMDQGLYMLSSSIGMMAPLLLRHLEALFALDHHDDFVSSEPTRGTFELFLKIFDNAFMVSEDGKEVTALPASLEYLSAAKGYPSDARSIMDIFLEQFTEFHEKYLPLTTGILLTQAGKRQQEPRYLVALPEKSTAYYHAREAAVLLLAIYTACRKHQAPQSNFLVLPRPLFNLVHHIDPFARAKSTEISGNVTPEKLLTTKTLHAKGMTLEEAWLSATKLS